MKTKQEKRAEAIARLQKSQYSDSRANRTGSRTEQQWGEWRNKEIARLSSLR